MIHYFKENLPVYILGEIFGSGVQDLTYGTSRQGDSKTDFRVFDIYIGLPGSFLIIFTQFI